MKLSESEKGADWLNQFRFDDLEVARTLLDSMLLVSANNFEIELRKKILEQAEEFGQGSPIALFNEREIHKNGYGEYPLYSQKSLKPRRAEGIPKKPIDPKIRVNPLIGSEGVVATFLSNLCREFPTKFVFHPSAEDVRRKKIRKFLFVTDMIGSGKRIVENLNSAWKVYSIKSWASYKLLSIGIVSYAATMRGMSLIREHNSSPTVSYVRTCPTIDGLFDGDLRQKIEDLCLRYNPRKLKSPFGYDDIGALVVFSHGCPNNVPPIFHDSTVKKWEPIFPNRTTANTKDLFEGLDKQSVAQNKFALLKEKELLDGSWMEKYTDVGQDMILFLSALKKSPRLKEIISLRTNLTTTNIEALIELARFCEWINDKLYLTDAGMAELRKAKSISLTRKPLLSVENDEYYYPKSLRAPF